MNAESIAMHRGILVRNGELDDALEAIIAFVFEQGFRHGKRLMAEAAGVTWNVPLDAALVYENWRGYGPGSELIGGSAYRKARGIE